MSEQKRPDFIDLRSTSQTSVTRPLRSPRLHVAGEVPPELSPLDAFALQSRLLARQLEEESTKAGRRMSRLPPLTTQSPLIVQGRSEYFRSMSQDSTSEDRADSPPQQQPTGLGLRTEVEESPNRPVSVHPRMSRIPPTPDESVPLPKLPSGEAFRGRKLNYGEQADTVFGARRELSPGPLAESSPSLPSDGGHDPTCAARDTYAPQQLRPSPSHGKSFPNSPETAPKKPSLDSVGLAPPRSLFPKRSSSIASSPLEPTDEEGSGSMSASFQSQPTGKLSSSGGGMVSPAIGAYQRSPSTSSEASGLPRPSFNFSRPLTRSGTPTLDSPARQASSDSQASFVLTDDTANTPVSMNGEGFPDALGEDWKSGAPSYIYSKFSLPRGKSLQRSSPALPEDQPVAAYRWEQPPIEPPSNIHTFPIAGRPPPSPPTRPSSSAGPTGPEDPAPRPSLDPGQLSMGGVVRPHQEPSPNPSRPSTEGYRDSEDAPRGRPLTSPLHDAARGKAPVSTNTSDTASTIKATRSQFSAATTDMTGEEHVTKAISLHENGSLKESTYHLRHAAKQGSPTGMLLYALACRHGWGMRPNQREGVEWLRKAAESASVEIADDEGLVKEGKNVDVVERRTRKAQFALSIYELGVSHMNGWGVEQDKALALRCFEIAGCKQPSSPTSPPLPQVP